MLNVTLKLFGISVVHFNDTIAFNYVMAQKNEKRKQSNTEHVSKKKRLMTDPDNRLLCDANCDTCTNEIKETSWWHAALSWRHRWSEAGRQSAQ